MYEHVNEAISSVRLYPVGDNYKNVKHVLFRCLCIIDDDNLSNYDPVWIVHVINAPDFEVDVRRFVVRSHSSGKN